MYDLIIRGGRIVDGTRKPAFTGDIAITGSRIEKIAEHVAGEAKTVIDAAGWTVSPGFVDIHCHSDLAPLAPFQPESILRQGVTFELGGNCGMSLLPSTPETRESITEYFVSDLQYPAKGITIDVHTMDDYVRRVEAKGESINYGLLVGHGVLRGCVMGFENRKPTPEEMEAMKQRLDQELSMGAFGMSLGLIYPPSAFAEPEEIEELAKVVKQHNGVLTVHLRNEGPRVFEAAKEMIAIAEHTGVHLEISHLKIMTKSLWGRSGELLGLIDAAKERGVNITADQYPFYASSTSLTALVPKWAHSGGIGPMLERIRKPEEKLKEDIRSEMESRGGAECVMISSTHGLRPEYEGRFLNEIAAETGEDPVDAVLRILDECDCGVNCNYFSQNEEDMLRIMKRLDVAVITDGYNFPLDRTILTDAAPHPRNFATFPHALELMRDRHLLPLEDAVYKMTGLPADIIGLTDRGRLSEGMIADITVFDAENVAMEGDFMHPFEPPRGIGRVIVSGQVVYEDGHVTGAKPGRVLRHS